MIFENLGLPLSSVMQVINISCIVQEIQKYEIEFIFLITLYVGWNNITLSNFVTGNTHLHMRQPSHNISLINDDYSPLSKTSHQVLCFSNQVELKTR